MLVHCYIARNAGHNYLHVSLPGHSINKNNSICTVARDIEAGMTCLSLFKIPHPPQLTHYPGICN